MEWTNEPANLGSGHSPQCHNITQFTLINHNIEQISATVADDVDDVEVLDGVDDVDDVEDVVVAAGSCLTGDC